MCNQQDNMQYGSRVPTKTYNNNTECFTFIDKIRDIIIEILVFVKYLVLEKDIYFYNYIVVI